MLARNETILKWLRYILAAALCFLIQGAALQRITLWGVIPFVYPLVAVIPATYEDPLFGTVFALVTGVVCERVVRPIRRVGLYVPAGSAPLPSTAPPPSSSRTCTGSTPPPATSPKRSTRAPCKPQRST